MAPLVSQPPASASTVASTAAITAATATPVAASIAASAAEIKTADDDANRKAVEKYLRYGMRLIRVCRPLKVGDKDHPVPCTGPSHGDLCTSAGKRPQYSFSFSHHVTALSQLSDDVWGDYNVGVLVGAVNGMLCFDVDPRDKDEKAGTDPVQAMRDLVHDCLTVADLSDTLYERTSEGGLHFYYSIDPDMRKDTLKKLKHALQPYFARKLALLGADTGRALVVAAPSTHISGERYVTVNDKKPLHLSEATVDALADRLLAYHGRTHVASLPSTPGALTGVWAELLEESQSVYTYTDLASQIRSHTSHSGDGVPARVVTHFTLTGAVIADPAQRLSESRNAIITDTFYRLVKVRFSDDYGGAQALLEQQGYIFDSDRDTVYDYDPKTGTGTDKAIRYIYEEARRLDAAMCLPTWHEDRPKDFNRLLKSAIRKLIRDREDTRR